MKLDVVVSKLLKSIFISDLVLHNTEHQANHATLFTELNKAQIIFAKRFFFFIYLFHNKLPVTLFWETLAGVCAFLAGEAVFWFTDEAVATEEFEFGRLAGWTTLGGIFVATVLLWSIFGCCACRS